MDTRSVLPINTVLDGSYRIVGVVGSGGFGITYEAEDINLGTTVAVKEYYPCDFGDRDTGMSVRPRSERHRHTFAWGRANFLEEARTLARFEHPSIVGVARVFEANSTAYMVMRFERGRNLEAWLSGLGRLPTQEELDRILFPLLDALETMHKAHFLHRDIAPDNIIVRPDGTPVLLDFGAARRAMAQMSRSLTGLVKPGYSPLEQYAGDGRLQGPWSDLYALGGTLYRAVTGRVPDEATLRIDGDRMPSLAGSVKGGYRPSFLAAIDACLGVSTADRPQSAAQLRAILLGQDTVSTPRSGRIISARKAPSKPQPLARTQRSTPPLLQRAPRQWLAIAAAMLAMLGGAYGGLEYARWQPAADREAEIGRKANEVAEAQEARRLLALAEISRKEGDERRAAEAAEMHERVRIAALEEASLNEVKAWRQAEEREAARQAVQIAKAEERATAPQDPAPSGTGAARGGAKKSGNAAEEKGKVHGRRPRPKSEHKAPSGESRPPRDVASREAPIQGIR